MKKILFRISVLVLLASLIALYFFPFGFMVIIILVAALVMVGTDEGNPEFNNYLKEKP